MTPVSPVLSPQAGATTGEDDNRSPRTRSQHRAAGAGRRAPERDAQGGVGGGKPTRGVRVCADRLSASRDSCLPTEELCCQLVETSCVAAPFWKETSATEIS
ncbi:hypothetical protein chiPu_0022709 [Chiloscyllium punctatum]|uniref:Uncharacterized protein n=1 Tax=Chiloscyllium punctatum TaxID=137246 RepID=A0A401T8U7_CHIPU|nr:hypothetical protein [Chiloscyllium punctatum]